MEEAPYLSEIAQIRPSSHAGMLSCPNRPPPKPDSLVSAAAYRLARTRAIPDTMTICVPRGLPVRARRKASLAPCFP